MLCVPYLKALRKENMLLLANVVAMLVSVAFSLISVYSFHSLEYLELSMLAAIALRNFISELYLGKLLNVDTLSRYAREVLLSICFLVVATLDSAPAYMGGLVVLTAYYGFELVLMLKERKGV